VRDQARGCKIHLRSVTYLRPEEGGQASFPFDVPLVKSLSTLEFTAPVTLFVGENGTGKSTVLEAIAAVAGSPTIGGEPVETDPTLAGARRLAERLRLVWTAKTHRGFFMRTEDFFSFARRISETWAEMQGRLNEIESEYRDRSAFARAQARSAYVSSISEMERRYGEDLDANSHGESLFTLLQARLVPDGLYLLDEPETPMSPVRQLAFLSMVKETVDKGGQFIIATHSPIIMAFPGASILSFDSQPPRKAQWEELQHVRITRDFLNDPRRFLRHFWEEEPS
jgi:predicted ATPase